MISRSEAALKFNVRNNPYWEGCNVRGLNPTNRMAKYSMAEFCTNCENLIEETKKEAMKYGIDPDEAAIPIIRELAENSLFFFAYYIIDEFYKKDYIYRLCLDVQENKWNRMWIIAREHFKTTIISQISTLWEICKNPKITVGVFSYKKPMACKIVAMIKNIIENSVKLKVIWPDIFWENPSQKFEIDKVTGRKIDFIWSNEALQLKQTGGGMDHTIEAHGISGASATGSHFSHLVFDDCETQDNVGTAEAIEKRYSEITMAVNTGKTNNLNMCFVGTFYAKEDAYARIIREGIVKEAIIQPCYDEYGQSILYTEEELENKRRTLGTLLAWAIQMLCDPSMSSQNVFDESWLRYWKPDPANLTGMNVYMFVDPASDKVRKDHDFTTIIAAGINSLKQILILEIVRDKLTFDGKFMALMRLHSRWHPINTYYEETSYASDVSHLSREMGLKNHFIPLSSYSPTHMGSKTQRIEKSIYQFSIGNVYLPEKSIQMNWQGVYEDVTKTVVKNEIFGYPNIKNDDFLDCLSAIVDFLSKDKITAPSSNIIMTPFGARKKQAETNYEFNAMEYAIKSSERMASGASYDS